MKNCIREPLGGTGHVGVDEVVVFLPANPSVLQTKIPRVSQERLSVGANVKAHGEHTPRVDSCGHRVDSQLADRNVDSTNTPVSDAQNRLGV